MSQLERAEGFADAKSRGGDRAVLDTLANRITGIRFLLALILFAFLQWLTTRPPSGAGLLAGVCFVLFAVAAGTDFLDGYLARRRAETSSVGRVADPFVDKVLVCGSFVFLAVAPATRDFVPAWVVAVVLAREFLVTTLRGWVESRGAAFPADAFGKFKMLVQSLAIGGVLLYVATPVLEGVVGWLARVLVVATVVLTVLSGGNYLWKARSLFAGGGPP
jgi:CDP-diacylglycerol--glycerol-3-phosphate 3-phosphatidyltransferase